MAETLLDRFSPEELRDRVGSLTVCRGQLFHRATSDDSSSREVDGAEVRAAGDDSDEWIVTGHAAVFDVLSEELGMFYRFKEKIDRGAFRKALDEDQDVVDVLDHAGLPLARTSSSTLELREDPRGLHTYSRWARSSYSDPIAKALERQDLKQRSFAFTVAEDEWIERNVEGQDEPEVIRTIKKVERLFDVSVVGQPAYPQTDAQLRALEIKAAGERFGVAVPDERLQDGGAIRTQLVVPRDISAGDSGAGAADGENESRGGVLTDLQDAAKRRLTIAQAKINVKG